MKHNIIFFALIALVFAACDTDVRVVESPMLGTHHAAMVSNTVEPACASNVAMSNHSVTSLYRDASFTLRFDQNVVTEVDGVVTLRPASVYQVASGVWLAELPGVDSKTVVGYIRLNTMTGTTSVMIDGKQRAWTKQPITP